MPNKAPSIKNKKSDEEEEDNDDDDDDEYNDDSSFTEGSDRSSGMDEDVASVGDDLDVSSLGDDGEEGNARLPEVNDVDERHDSANGGNILQVSTRSLNDGDVSDDVSENSDGVGGEGSANEDENDYQSMEPEKLIIKTEKLAIKYKNKKMSDAAVKEYIKCLALASIIYEQSDWRLYNYRVLLAFAYQELKGYSAQALQHCNVAHLFLANIHQYDIKGENTFKSPHFHKFLFNLYYTSGLALTSTKKYCEAEDLLLKAKNILTNLVKNQQKMGDCESNLVLALARLYHKFDKPDLSLKFYEKAVEMEIARNGRHSVKLISIYQNLGKVEQNQNSSINHERAIEYFLKAHAIANHNFNIKSLQVADTAYNVGLAYANVNEDHADISAEEYFKEALGSFRSTLGSNHRKTLETVDELSRLYIRTDRIAEAIGLLKKSLRMKEEAFGYYSKELADTYKIIGTSYMSLGDVEQSWKAFEKCHNIECTMYGQNHKCSKDTKETLDILMRNPMVASKLASLATSSSSQKISSCRLSSAKSSRPNK